MPSLAGRRLYLCTPDRPDLAEFIDACIRGGVDVVQLREKALDARPLVGRAAVAREVCASHGVPFILNDRADLALECGADGVHVGQDDASPGTARRILGPSAIVGLSTHAPEQLEAALRLPEGTIDYVSVGPVVPTPTKPGRPGTGLDYVARAAGGCPLPFFVTGGAAPDTVADLVAAGARRFVAVRWLTEATDPGAAAAALRGAIDAAISSQPPPGAPASP